ncbi:hypothetical protein GCM10028794_28570 [Silanimonas algicola]
MNAKAIFILLATLSTPALTAAETGTFEEAVQLHEASKHAEARTIFEALDAKGDARATYALGFVYRRGIGIQADPAKAITYFERAADAGHSSAKNELGLMFLHGQGVFPNFQRAYELFESAAEQGDAYAMVNSAEFPFMADAESFTEQVLAKSLARAQQAAAEGRPNMDGLIGTLKCALNAEARPPLDTLVRESIRQHELNGPARAVKNGFSGDSHYFSKGGYLLRTDFGTGSMEHRFIYSSDCKLKRWEAIEVARDGSGRVSLRNFENYEYVAGRIARVSTPNGNAPENIRRYEYFPQNDGGIVEASRLDGEHPSWTFIKRDSKGLVMWANGGLPVYPTANLEIVPGSGVIWSQPVNAGTRNMTLQGGSQYRRDRDGRITAIVDNNAMDYSTQYIVEYTYGRHGWVTAETLRDLSGRNRSTTATYEAYEVDSRGNWTSRTKRYTRLGQERELRQAREIYYY